MKKILLILIVFSCASCFGQTFGSQNAKWHYSSSADGLAPFASEYFLYEVAKDTTYQNVLAKKIEITHYRYAGDTLNRDPLYVYEKNDSVFYYNDQQQKYLLLYDFTASVGDTLLFPTPDTNSIDSIFRIVIDSIGTDTISNVLVNTFIVLH